MLHKHPETINLGVIIFLGDGTHPHPLAYGSFWSGLLCIGLICWVLLKMELFQVG